VCYQVFLHYIAGHHLGQTPSWSNLDQDIPKSPPMKYRYSDKEKFLDGLLCDTSSCFSAFVLYAARIWFVFMLDEMESQSREARNSKHNTAR